MPGIHAAAYRGALRMRGGGEDGTLVIAQHLEPAANIGSVVLPVLELQPEIGAEERGPELGDEFFLRVAGIAEALLLSCGRAATGDASSEWPSPWPPQDRAALA